MDICCLLFGSIALWEKVIYDFPFDSRPATKCKEKKLEKQNSSHSVFDAVK